MAFAVVKNPKAQKSISTDQADAPRVTYSIGGETYIITSDFYRKNYVCWRAEGKSFVKEATADNPMPLYDYIEKKHSKK